MVNDGNDDNSTYKTFLGFSQKMILITLMMQIVTIKNFFMN